MTMVLSILQHALGRNQYGHNPHGGPDKRWRLARKAAA